MNRTVESVDGAAATAREWESDRNAWNLPRRPRGTDTYVAPIQSDSDRRLDWEAFSARYFPGSRRHDLRAIVSYAAYKRRSGSPHGSDKKETADSMVGERPLETWENEGGAILAPVIRELAGLGASGAGIPRHSEGAVSLSQPATTD
jgi:hypothetical protein